MEGVFSNIKISGSGMSVQRRKMDVVAENIANAETTSTEEGGPYRRRRVEVEAASEKLPFQTVLKNSQASLTRTRKRHIAGMPSGIRRQEIVSIANSKEVVEGPDASKLIYDPSHPDANDEGYVEMPDIEIINEMVDMISANRAYEANAMAISASKEMLKNALEI
jgi:flagellar basal-body rod protein FlgC